MSTDSTMHLYFNWAHERIAEMDAALTSLEAKATQVRADAKVKAEQSISELRKRRGEFEALARRQLDAGEAAWLQIRPELESLWHGFEVQLKTYLETLGKQVEHQPAAFREIAAAQIKAWREAADRLRDQGAKMAAAKAADIDAAVKQMEAGADEAYARLERLRQVGSESWSGFSAALAESRKAFDRANNAAWDALKRSAAPKF